MQNLAGTIVSAREKIRYCSCCWNLTDSELCPICANPKRDHHVIMVVETPRDLAAYEKTQKYEGVYHVLHGAISPMLGIGPSDIRLKELMTRLQGDVTEVIIATNSTLKVRQQRCISANLSNQQASKSVRSQAEFRLEEIWNI